MRERERQSKRATFVHVTKSTPYPPQRERQRRSNNLRKLTTDGTRDGLRRVHIAVEVLGVGLDHSDGETRTGVHTSGVVDDTRLEGARQAAGGDAEVLALDGLRVGESDARGAELALVGLVDVGGRVGGRGVLAAEVDELDVVADDVEVGVDAEVVVADGAGETAGEAGSENGSVSCLTSSSMGWRENLRLLASGAADDLVGGGLHLVGGGEGDGETLGLLVVLLWARILSDVGTSHAIPMFTTYLATTVVLAGLLVLLSVVGWSVSLGDGLWQRIGDCGKERDGDDGGLHYDYCCFG